MSRKVRRISEKSLVLTALIGCLLILSMVSANTIWSSKRATAATSEAVSAVSSFYLEAMAERSAKTITNLISNNFYEMEQAVTFIEGEHIDSQEDLRSTIGRLESLLGLNRFALVDEDNVVYTQYTTYTGGSRHAFLAEDHLSDRIISTVSLYGSSKQLCLAIPITNLSALGKHFKACFVQLDISDIVELLAFDDQGRTYFALYTNTGGNLSGTELGSVVSHHNLFDALRNVVPEDVWEENYQNFVNGEKGSLLFSSGDIEETLCYVPIRDTGWEMAVLIRESVIEDQIRDVSAQSLEASKNQIVFALASVLLLAAILLLEFWHISKAKLEEEQEASRTLRDMANTDSLTGVGNKHAYTEIEKGIDQQIQAGELQSLGVVVADINGLKHVNDTQGHAAGDQLIKDACALVCDYFSGESVFRIGGDEFVVLLQGEGCDTMHEVIRELNRKVEKNIETNDVVVSVGHSVLDQNDQRLNDVFERADHMMYERKKELKSLGARTR
jgi:diguanylate cyclase (GGDEF)-like protein